MDILGPLENRRAKLTGGKEKNHIDNEIRAEMNEIGGKGRTQGDSDP